MRPLYRQNALIFESNLQEFGFGFSETGRKEKRSSRQGKRYVRGLTLAQGGDAVGDLGEGQVFYVGGDGPLVIAEVGDSRQAVAVGLVGGLGYGGGTDGYCLGVDGVAVGYVEVDEAGGGRVLGRQGVGEHQGCAGDLDLGVADAALGHGHSDVCVKWDWCRPPLILPMRVCWH